MAFKTIAIKQKSKLSTKDNQLVITNDDGVFDIPIEDIQIIVVENNGTVITSPLLVQLAKYDTVMVICDDKQLPIGIYYPYLQHSRQAKRLTEQLQISLPLHKQLWKEIIRQKILNQAEYLKLLGKENDYQKLKNLIPLIKSNDSDNQEALAARIYFECLFGKNFTRDQDTPINAKLNYTYTIVRALIVRYIVQYGLLPIFGIKHYNEYNNFNLADDLIESYRAIIDEFVCNYEFTECDSQFKAYALQIFTKPVRINNQQTTLQNSIEILVKSYITVIKSELVENIKLPAR